MLPEIFGALATMVEAETAPQTTTGSAPALDLSTCSIIDLARLYEAFRSAQDVTSNALQCSCFWTSRGPLGDMTAGGNILDLEQDRLGRTADACAAEIAKRVPANQRERDEALSTRLAHELACEGRIGDAALLRDIVEAWTPAPPAAA